MISTNLNEQITANSQYLVVHLNRAIFTFTSAPALSRCLHHHTMCSLCWALYFLFFLFFLNVEAHIRQHKLTTSLVQWVHIQCSSKFDDNTRSHTHLGATWRKKRTKSECHTVKDWSQGKWAQYVVMLWILSASSCDTRCSIKIQLSHSHTYS